jgi:hypothetical protein
VCPVECVGEKYLASVVVDMGSRGIYIYLQPRAIMFILNLSVCIVILLLLFSGALFLRKSS